MVSIDDLKIKTKSSKVNEEHGTRVVIVYADGPSDKHGGEHADWKSDVSKWEVKEPREMPREHLTVNVKKSGNDIELSWKQTWDLDTTKYMEVYGVLRAEWYFGKVKGMKKVDSKVNGNHGIDSLFVDSSGNYHIVESKCSGDVAKYAKYLTFDPGQTDPHSSERGYSAVERLGEIVRHLPVKLAKKSSARSLAQLLGEVEDFNKKNAGKCVTLCITQMTEQWIGAKIREMLREAPGSKVQANGKALSSAAQNGKVSRWFNFYGTYPFYRLPGKYKIERARKAEFMASGDTKGSYIKGRPRELDWPDGKGDKKEFILLDRSKDFKSEERQEKKQNINAAHAAGW